MTTTMKKHGRQPLLAAAFASRKTDLGEKAVEFVEWLKVKNSPRTVKMRMASLHLFLSWGEERAITKLSDLTPLVIEEYEKYLVRTRDNTGKPLTAINRYCHLTAVAKFCRWLVQRDVLISNPAAKLVYPKVAKNLPKTVLKHKQIEEILSQPDTNTPLGIRDRAIMEMLYSSGIRRAEAVGLTIQDVDFENGLVYVRHGKGDKARVVPVGERALEWLKKYLLEVRPTLVKDRDAATLFVGCRGLPINPNSLSVWVTNYVRKSGQTGGCHLFRHAMATEMLDHGADVRHIQEILGHENINTTQIYTHTSIEKIKEVYLKTHPCGQQDEAHIGNVSSKVLKHKSETSPRPVSPTPWPENELSRWVQEYLTSLRMANYSENSVADYQWCLKPFALWCQKEGISELKFLSSSVLEKYYKSVASKETRGGRTVGIKCISVTMVIVRQFCRFLWKKEALSIDIAQKLELPRVKKSIPCQVLTPQEVARILAQVDVRSALGLRDRAVLEVLYATGMRRNELGSLETGDINAEAGTVFIRKGKGGKQRIVPIAKSTLAWVEKYLECVRPLLVRDETEKLLFLSNNGHPLDWDAFANSLKRYAKKAGIEKPVSCHKFRHAMATALLDNGADIRTVQEILGHESLASTQLYTKVAIRKLKEVHERTHPAHSKPQSDRKDDT